MDPALSPPGFPVPVAIQPIGARSAAARSVLDNNRTDGSCWAGLPLPDQSVHRIWDLRLLTVPPFVDQGLIEVWAIDDPESRVPVQGDIRLNGHCASVPDHRFVGRSSAISTHHSKAI